MSTARWSRSRGGLLAVFGMTGVCGVSTAADRAPQVLEGDGALDDGTYPAGVKIPDSQLEALPLTKHDFHGDWNYTITPT